MGVVFIISVNYLLMSNTKADEYSKFISDISKLESSSGKNTNHHIIKYGIHAGQQAIGNYGLMPNTILDVLTREKDVPNFNKYENIKNIQLRTELIIKDPLAEDFVLHSLYNYIKKRQNNNLEKMIYAWEAGHYLKSSDITLFQLETSERIRRYRKLKGNLNGYNTSVASTSSRR